MSAAVNAAERERVLADVRAAASALREAEAQEIKAAEKAEKTKRITGLRRLELGRALYEARKLWPRSGPKAKGWGDFLDREGFEQSTAWRLMKDAGFDPDEISCTPAERMKSDKEKAKPQLRIVAPPRGFDLRVGDWHQVLADVGTVDAVIVDPPYSERTHSKSRDGVREDGWDDEGLAPNYTAWDRDDVDAFVGEWHPRCRGWMVALTDHHLIGAWTDAYERHGRYAFAPVPCVIQGMSVRLGGDGPSSWAVYAMVSRPASLLRWGTLPGAYTGGREAGSKAGRGKPSWLMDAIVADYSRGGDLVCDPLAGYGVTLLSALRLGRRAVGAEIDSEVHAEAMARASAAPPQAETDSAV